MNSTQIFVPLICKYAPVAQTLQISVADPDPSRSFSGIFPVADPDPDLPFYNLSYVTAKKTVVD
jgi:hypothetical protein